MHLIQNNWPHVVRNDKGVIIEATYHSSPLQPDAA